MTLNNHRPDEFVASIGGFSGASYKITLGPNESVIYSFNPHTFTHGPGTTHTEIRIDEPHWREFRQALNEAKVWEWRTRYQNPDILDGTTWHLSIKYPDASIETSGNNDYPDAKSFAAFKAAVSALLDGEEFR